MGDRYARRGVRRMNTQRLADMCLSDNPFVRAEGAGKLCSLLDEAYKSLRAIERGTPSPAVYARVAADLLALVARDMQGGARA